LENLRNFSGYHLSADGEGCGVIRERVGRLDGSGVFSVSFPVVAPDAGVLGVPNNEGGRARVLAARRFRVEAAPTLEPGTFLWAEVEDTFVLTCSGEFPELILKGIADVERGVGDYSIGGKSGPRLWFWW
jgi:hypothetical protein